MVLNHGARQEAYADQEALSDYHMPWLGLSASFLRRAGHIRDRGSIAARGFVVTMATGKGNCLCVWLELLRLSLTA